MDNEYEILEGYELAQVGDIITNKYLIKFKNQRDITWSPSGRLGQLVEDRHIRDFVYIKPITNRQLDLFK